MKKLELLAIEAMVRTVLAEADKHVYSTSRVYAAYNSLLGTDEEPQSCPSCLKTRVAVLRAEMAKRKADEANKTIAEIAATKVDAAAKAQAAAAIDVRGAEVLGQSGEWVEEISEVGDWVTVTGRQIGHQGTVLGIRGDDTEMDENSPEALGQTGETATIGGLTKVGEAQMDENSPEHAAPALGVVRYPMAEGQPLDLTPGEEPGKGLVAYADGTKVKAGTYETATGDTIAVQPGGKATVKPAEDLL